MRRSEADVDVFAAASIQMSSPPRDTVADISVAEALTVIGAADFPPDMVAGAPETVLKVVTNDPTGGVPLKPGEVSGGYSERLAWVVMYRGVSATARMPMLESGVSRLATDCVSVFVVDASDAELVDVVRLC